MCTRPVVVQKRSAYLILKKHETTDAAEGAKQWKNLRFAPEAAVHLQTRL